MDREPERSGWIEARAEQEGSHGVVWLDVYIVDDDGTPTRVETRRIRTCHSIAEARIAASWIQRGARRGVDPFPEHRRDDPIG